MKEFIKPMFEIIEIEEDQIVCSVCPNGDCVGDSVVCEVDWCYQVTGEIDAW